MYHYNMVMLVIGKFIYVITPQTYMVQLFVMFYEFKSLIQMLYNIMNTAYGEIIIYIYIYIYIYLYIYIFIYIFIYIYMLK